MAQSIGDAIKKLRKELNMTQAQLAGDEMTKSMLSQIENNLAYPSMKNLKYIAQRLGKPLSYFLDDQDSIQRSQPVDEISSVLKECDFLLEKHQNEKAFAKINEITSKYKFDDKSKNTAYYLYVLGRCLIYLNRDAEGETKIHKAIDIFVKNESYIEASKAYMELATIMMGSNFKYEEAISMIQKSEEMYKRFSLRDIVHEIDILYCKSYTHSAMGLTAKAEDDLDNAIKITQESNIYHMTDELYRFKAVICYETDRFEEFLENINKAMQFADLIENKPTLARAALNKAMYYTRFNEIEKAKEYIKIFEDNKDRMRFLYYIIKSVLYYDDRNYEKALETIMNVDYSYYITHKYDYLLLWTAKTYEGMILYKLGRTKKAVESINESICKLEHMGKSINLAYANKNLSSIYYDMGDYRSAYETLNKSTGFNLPEKYLI